MEGAGQPPVEEPPEPPPEDPPPEDPPPAPLDRVASLVVLGDSISDGGGGGPRYYRLLERNDDALYPEWAGRDLRTRNPDLRVQRRAQSGSTTAALLRQVNGIDADLPGPVAVVVTSGGNDIKEQMLAALSGLDGLAVEGARLNLGLALDAIPLRLAGRELRVYLANIYDPSDGQGNFGAHCRFARDFGVLAVPTDPIFARWNDAHASETRRTGQVLVDLHAAFYGHGFNAADRWYEGDCTHPNRVGHHRLRALFWAAITGDDVAL